MSPLHPRRLLNSLDLTTQNWLTILTGDVARMALGLISSVIIARALGPGGYGTYAVLAAAAGITGALADFGLSATAIKRIAGLWHKDPLLAGQRGRSFFWIRLVAAAAVVAIAWLLAGQLRPLLGFPEQIGPFSAVLLLAMAFLGVLASALSGAASTLLQAMSRFKAVSLLLVSNTALTVLLAIGLAALDELNLLTALVVLGILPSLATFALSFRFLPRQWSWRPPPLPFLRREGQQLLVFGRWLWLANALAALTLQLDVVMLNRLSTAQAVGVYGLALNLVTKVDIINRSLYAVLLPTASALNSRKEMGQYVVKSLLRGAAISFLLLPAALLGRPFILFFYGPAYEPAIGLFHLLLGVVLVDIFSTPILLLAFPLDQPRLVALTEAARGGTLLLAALWLIPVYGPAGAAVARLVSRGAGLLVILLVWQRLRLDHQADLRSTKSRASM